MCDKDVAKCHACHAKRTAPRASRASRATSPVPEVPCLPRKTKVHNKRHSCTQNASPCRQAPRLPRKTHVHVKEGVCVCVNPAGNMQVKANLSISENSDHSASFRSLITVTRVYIFGTAGGQGLQ